MNVEIGAEGAKFPEKEYINGIAVEVYYEPCMYHEAVLTAVHHIFAAALQPFSSTAIQPISNCTQIRSPTISGQDLFRATINNTTYSPPKISPTGVQLEGNLIL
jgi:hypothetical protein